MQFLLFFLCVSIELFPCVEAPFFCGKPLKRKVIELIKKVDSNIRFELLTFVTHE